MFIGDYRLPNFLTYLGLSLSTLALFFLVNQQLIGGLLCFSLSGVCDLFDGQFARSFERTREQAAFGMELDSLCDVINFGAVPALLLMTHSHLPLVGLLVAGLYLIAAVSRLAYFNQKTKEEGASRWFTGLPVTYSALVLPLFYVGCRLSQPKLFALGLPLVGLVLSLAFVSRVAIPRPGKVAYIGFSLLALLVVGYLLGDWLWF